MRRFVKLIKRATALRQALKHLRSAQKILHGTGWVQDSKDFAEEIELLVRRVQAESDASERLSRKDWSTL